MDATNWATAWMAANAGQAQVHEEELAFANIYETAVFAPPSPNASIGRSSAPSSDARADAALTTSPQNNHAQRLSVHGLTDDDKSTAQLLFDSDAVHLESDSDLTGSRSPSFNAESSQATSSSQSVQLPRVVLNPLQRREPVTVASDGRSWDDLTPGVQWVIIKLLENDYSFATTVSAILRLTQLQISDFLQTYYSSDKLWVDFSNKILSVSMEEFAEIGRKSGKSLTELIHGYRPALCTDSLPQDEICKGVEFMRSRNLNRFEREFHTWADTGRKDFLGLAIDAGLLRDCRRKATLKHAISDGRIDAKVLEKRTVLEKSRREAKERVSNSPFGNKRQPNPNMSSTQSTQSTSTGSATIRGALISDMIPRYHTLLPEGKMKIRDALGAAHPEFLPKFIPGHFVGTFHEQGRSPYPPNPLENVPQIMYASEKDRNEKQRKTIASQLEASGKAPNAANRQNGPALGFPPAPAAVQHGHGKMDLPQGVTRMKATPVSGSSSSPASQRPVHIPAAPRTGHGYVSSPLATQSLVARNNFKAPTAERSSAMLLSSIMSQRQSNISSAASSRATSIPVALANSNIAQPTHISSLGSDRLANNRQEVFNYGVGNAIASLPSHRQLAPSHMSVANGTNGLSGPRCQKEVDGHSSNASLADERWAPHLAGAPSGSTAFTPLFSDLLGEEDGMDTQGQHYQPEVVSEPHLAPHTVNSTTVSDMMPSQELRQLLDTRFKRYLTPDGIEHFTETQDLTQKEFDGVEESETDYGDDKNIAPIPEDDDDDDEYTPTNTKKKKKVAKSHGQMDGTSESYISQGLQSGDSSKKRRHAEMQGGRSHGLHANDGKNVSTDA